MVRRELKSLAGKVEGVSELYQRTCETHAAMRNHAIVGCIFDPGKASQLAGLVDLAAIAVLCGRLPSR